MPCDPSRLSSGAVLDRSSGPRNASLCRRKFNGAPQSAMERRLDFGARRRVRPLAGAGDRGSAGGEAQPLLDRGAVGGGRAVAERGIAIHGRKQRGHEAVAGAHGVDDLDAPRGDRDSLAAEYSQCAALAERRDAEARSDLRPGGEAVLDRPAGIEPQKVLLARLDDVGERRLPLDQRSDGLAVRRDERSYVRIVADGRMRTRRRERLDDAFAMPRIDGGNRADMQVAAGRRPDRGKRPWAVERGRIEVERIARSGLGGAAHDEGERRGPLVAQDEPKVDAVLRQAGGQRLSVSVL